MVCCAVLSDMRQPPPRPHAAHRQLLQRIPEDMVVAEGTQCDQLEDVLRGDRGDLQQHTGGSSVRPACCC